MGLDSGSERDVMCNVISPEDDTITESLTLPSPACRPHIVVQILAKMSLMSFKCCKMC